MGSVSRRMPNTTEPLKESDTPCDRASLRDVRFAGTSGARAQIASSTGPQGRARLVLIGATRESKKELIGFRSACGKSRRAGQNSWSFEECPAGVLHQMPAICDLNRVRRGLLPRHRPSLRAGRWRGSRLSDAQRAVPGRLQGSSSSNRITIRGVTLQTMLANRRPRG